MATRRHGERMTIGRRGDVSPRPRRESVRPRLRGVSHQIAAGVAAVAGGVLVALAPSARAAAAAAAYAFRRPDPGPAVFGYHEVFHALVIGASACHFVAIARVVRGAA